MRHEVATLDDEKPHAVSDSACAMVAPPAPLPITMTSKLSVRMPSGGRRAYRAATGAIGSSAVTYTCSISR
jgi:hypothetical protein